MKRKLGRHHIKTFLRPASIVAAQRCFAVCKQPFRLLYHYITKHPLPAEAVTFRFRTPTGDIELKAFSAEDVITLFIVFCRKEYTPLGGARVFVDFGSNIGVTAAFFLSRNTENVVYCYEPNATNIERLRENLRSFESRYILEETCVGLENGTVTFGVESTGVYGAIGAEHEGGATTQVPCRNANDIIAQIMGEQPAIDFLKIDIEGLEQDVIKALKPEFLENIKQIQAETGEFDYRIPGFRKNQSGAIIKYERQP
jgi:FkbM family methyltransferase